MRGGSCLQISRIPQAHPGLLLWAINTEVVLLQRRPLHPDQFCDAVFRQFQQGYHLYEPILSIILVPAHALGHVFEIEVEDARGELVDQGALVLVVVIALLTPFIVVVFPVRIGVLLLDEFAHGLDVLLAGLGLVQAVGTDRGLKGACKRTWFSNDSALVFCKRVMMCQKNSVCCPPITLPAPTD